LIGIENQRIACMRKIGAGGCENKPRIEKNETAYQGIIKKSFRTDPNKQGKEQD
jgi:hypothetical protein